MTAAMILAASFAGATTFDALCRGAAFARLDLFNCRLPESARRVLLVGARRCAAGLLFFLLATGHQSDRHPVMHCFLRSIGAIGVAAALAAGERDAQRGDERQHPFEEIAGRVRQQMKQQRQNES